MAIAIPVATKLVQENQDLRNSAASCGTSGTISQCGSKGGCATGYRCLPKGCSYDPACGGFVPTSTPKPNQCTNGYRRCNGIQLQKCQNGNWVMVENCSYGCSNGVCKSAPTATAVPPTNAPEPTAKPSPTSVATPKPTATSTPTGCHSGVIGKCGSQGNCTTGYRCISNGAGGFHCSYDPACGGFVPTNTPIPNECSGNSKRCNGIQLQKCQNGNWVMVENCSYGCSNGACKAAPTATRTPTNTPQPTAMPTSTPSCLKENSMYQEGKCCPGLVKVNTPYGAICGKQGSCQPGQSKCSDDQRFVLSCDTSGYFQQDKACDGGCENGKCKTVCTPKQTKCFNSRTLEVCSDNGSAWVKQSCSYGCSNGACKAAPTATRTPTNTPQPTAMPTSTPSCLKENSMYQEGKCCPGLVKVNTPYGAICGKQGSCQPGQSKCSDDQRFVLSCDTSGYFQQDKACDGGCENGKCKTVCTPKQTKCFNSRTLEVCSDNGSAWVKQSCSYGCVDNRCLEKPTPVPSSMPTVVSCVPGKKTCTGNKGLMICNSQGNGYDQFTCGIGCLWGRCIGEQVAVGPVTESPNCVSGEYKCEASNGHYVEYKCNSGGYWDAVKQCDSGCFYGRCKNTDSEGCLKKNSVYQDGKCCPGLVRVTTPYGYVCGEPGGCTPGSKKCQDGSVWRCNNSGYFEKSQRCDFGCEGGECQLGCMPRSARCRDEKTLQVCADNGNAWVNRSCNFCYEGICYDSKAKALEVINFGGVDWDGENLPYCQNPSAETVGLNTCPQGFICGAQKVEDRNGLYYCERKSKENSTVKVCSPNSSFCGQGGVLLQCSADGNRWSGAWQCPQPRPEKGNQYNYSCKQVTADRGECRPATPEEGRETAVEIVGLTAATVAGVLGLPAVVTGGGLSSAMLVAQGASAAYSVGNAAYNCQYYSQLTQEQREACWKSGAYAVINTGSAMLGMAQFQGVNNAATTYGGLAVSAADLGMGTIDAMEVCQNSANPTECYLAIASVGVNALGFAGDVANASNFYQQQQLLQQWNYQQALAGNQSAFNALPLGWRSEVDDIIGRQSGQLNNVSVFPLTISQDSELVTVYRGIWTKFDNLDPRSLSNINLQRAGMLRDLSPEQVELGMDYMRSHGINFIDAASTHKINTRNSPFLGLTTNPDMAALFAGEGGTIIVAQIPANELYDLDAIRVSMRGEFGSFAGESEFGILGALDPSRIVEIYNAPPSDWNNIQAKWLKTGLPIEEIQANLNQIYTRQTIIPNFDLR